MTHDDWTRWVRNQLVQVASNKYPNNIQQQMIYQIGFLESQLAGAIRTDSRVYDNFKRSVQRASRR